MRTFVSLFLVTVSCSQGMTGGARLDRYYCAARSDQFGGQCGHAPDMGADVYKGVARSQPAAQNAAISGSHAVPNR